MLVYREEQRELVHDCTGEGIKGIYSQSANYREFS